MIGTLVRKRRKLSLQSPFGRSYSNMAGSELKLDLGEHERRTSRSDYSSSSSSASVSDVSPGGSGTRATASSPGLSILSISSRFNMGKSKDAKAKAKDKKKGLGNASSPTQPHLGLRLSEFRVEVLKEWEASFNSLLKHEEGVELFECFLKSEFSEENIQFWKACEKYKNSPDHMVKKEASVVYEEYLAPQAPKLINIDHQTSKEIVENMKSPDRTTFSKAQQSIYLLMARDSFVRFIKSDHFQGALKR